FLRGVAPAEDRIDPATGRIARGLGTGEIYRGVLPFVAVQLLVMSALIAFPQIVRIESGRTQRLDEAAVNEILRRGGGSVGQPPTGDPAALLQERLQREREGR
ncbi:MAG: hypothetical protein ABI699_14810, partial [Caldimonas sp.]